MREVLENGLVVVIKMCPCGDPSPNRGLAGPVPQDVRYPRIPLRCFKFTERKGPIRIGLDIVSLARCIGLRGFMDGISTVELGGNPRGISSNICHTPVSFIPFEGLWDYDISSFGIETPSTNIEGPPASAPSVLRILVGIYGPSVPQGESLYEGNEKEMEIPFMPPGEESSLLRYRPKQRSTIQSCGLRCAASLDGNR
ncbi:hypothetical protein I7I51_02439 [Histoplasma capsulatum]|uniref:Uncharacterized protein n=1 Tax=Ajellomyces capsulatus TaxID=5037 RepID=A0A8A1MBX3_AJECA|nr:hypothetical protein I7I51_02439 [Histoplasma capsulatum]